MHRDLLSVTVRSYISFHTASHMLGDVGWMRFGSWRRLSIKGYAA
jgi:hypothetical protein